MPLVRRVPKRGFHNIFRKEFAIVNISRFEELEGDTFTPESLLADGVISRLRDGLKILGNGELTRAITISAHKFSDTAKGKIESAGGKAEVIAGRKPFRRS